MGNKGSTVAGKVLVRKKSPRNALFCPNCGKGRIFDEGVDTKTEMKVIESDDDPWRADYYVKCKICKAVTGVRKLNN